MDQSSTTKRKNVLVVCHGNICRSPLCAAILMKYSKTLSIESRGLKVSFHNKAAKKVREYATEKGYDLSSHRSMQCIQSDVAWADIIIYMDNGNRARLTSYELQGKQLVCLADMIDEMSIKDPNFIPKGVELDKVLNKIKRASIEFCKRYDNC